MFGQPGDELDINYEHLFCQSRLKSLLMEFINKTQYKNISILSASRVIKYFLYIKFMTEAKKLMLKLVFKA